MAGRADEGWNMSVESDGSGDERARQRRKRKGERERTRRAGDELRERAKQVVVYQWPAAVERRGSSFQGKRIEVEYDA